MRAIHHRPVYARFYTLTALGFLFGIIYGMFSLALPIFGERLFGNVAIVGIVFAIPEIFGVILDIPLGAFSTHFGRRRTIVGAGLTLVLSAVLFSFSRTASLFIVALALYELATQAFIIPVEAEVTALSPPARTGWFSGVQDGFHNFGFSIGPILAGLLLALGQPKGAFWLAGVFSLVLVLGAAGALSPQATRQRTFISSLKLVWRRDHVFAASLREFRTLGFLGSFLVFLFFIFALHWGFIGIAEPIFTDQLGFSPFLIGLIYAAFTIPYIVVSVWAGQRVDHHGPKIIALVGLFLLAFATAAFTFTVSPLWFFVFSLLAGIGDALLIPAIFSVLDNLSSYHTKERLAGVTVFAESLGYFLGPLAAGLVTRVAGFGGSFLTMGIFIFIVAITTIFVSFEVKAR